MKGQANGFRQIEMRLRRTTRKRRQEAGIALLIAIFILLLIGVVAIALVVSSGTESALAGNYRSSTNVYYAAVAGLEEVRARLRSNNPNSFNNTAPGFLPPPATPLERTALAVLPNRSQQLMQYLVAPTSVSLPPFLAALTIGGSSANSVAFSAPTSNANYSIKGGDQDSVNGCAPGLPVHAVGVFNAADQANVTAGGNGGTGIPAADRPNYTGSSGAPDVNVIATVPASLQSPAQLEALVQSITQSADVVLPGPAKGANLPPSMYSPSPDPMTIVVNGDLDLTGWHQTGYGLLLVRGNLNYDPDASC